MGGVRTCQGLRIGLLSVINQINQGRCGSHRPVAAPNPRQTFHLPLVVLDKHR